MLEKQSAGLWRPVRLTAIKLWLIRISQTAHTTHNAQHIVIGRVNTDFGGSRSKAIFGLKCVGGSINLECGGVNPREVASSTRLVFFGC